MKSIPLAPKQPARHGGRLVSTVGVVGAWVMTGWVVDVWAFLPPHALSTTSTQAKIATGDFIVMVRYIPRRRFGSPENIGNRPLMDDI